MAKEIVIEVHGMSLLLPRFELFKEGSQIRRSSKTVKSCIAEGYGRRRYKQEWIKFLVYALSSNDETIDHLETIWETKSLTNLEVYNNLHDKIERPGKMLNGFLKSVEERHQSAK